jgi:hypothetical protein
MKHLLLGFRKLSKRAAGATQKPQAAVGGLSIGYQGTRIAGLYYGTVALVAGVATINNSNVQAGSIISVNRQTSAGTISIFYEITARTPGTSFVITGRSAPGTTQTLDTSTVAWQIINPQAPGTA